MVAQNRCCCRWTQQSSKFACRENKESDMRNLHGSCKIYFHPLWLMIMLDLTRFPGSTNPHSDPPSHRAFTERDHFDTQTRDTETGDPARLPTRPGCWAMGTNKVKKCAVSKIIFCTGLTREAKAEQKSHEPARRAQQNNQGRTPFIYTPKAPICLSFNSQPSLSGLCGSDCKKPVNASYFNI